MTYKGMFLSALTVLIPITSYTNENSARIKELEEALFEKQLELSEIGEMIAKRDELLRSFEEGYQDLFTSLVEKKVTQIETNNDGKELSKDEKRPIAQELLNSINRYTYAVYEAYLGKETIKNMLTDGLFNQDDLDGCPEFESLKFFLIRCTFERGLVVKLVQKYEACIQELSTINQELDTLKQQVNQ